jgi:hypothetical protein
MTNDQAQIAGKNPLFMIENKLNISGIKYKVRSSIINNFILPFN